MAREYYKAYHSHLEMMDNLSDAEIGRLYMSCLRYSKSGTSPDLRGNERFIWPAIKGEIDRDKSKYATLCKTNQKNAAKGGKANATERYRTLPNGGQTDKEKDNISATTAAATTRTREAELYNADFALCAQSYEANIGAITQSIAEGIIQRLEQLPADLICEAISEAARNNARNWAYIDAILRRCVDMGVRTASAFAAEKANSQRTAQRRGTKQQSGNPFLQMLEDGYD